MASHSLSGDDNVGLEADPCTQDLIGSFRHQHVRGHNRNDDPNYWTDDPSSLLSKSVVHSIAFGSGHGLFQASILPAIANAEHEVIFVTCFWARSATLTDLGEALRSLSAKALQNGRKIRVRIGFSSCSLAQKLFHTRSLSGRPYPPSSWRAQLGLPDAEQLNGLDLSIKSIFVLPFSVMHPKFVVIDRRRALLPSCNVSWENWFEGCIDLSGPVVRQFVDFYNRFWLRRDGTQPEMPFELDTKSSDNQPVSSSVGLLASQQIGLLDVTTVFLPSPHRVNPRFAFPWRKHYPPPSTPLNIYLQALFARAERKIEFQTPNLTAPPVIEAIKAALQRGVDVSIITSERLMILEQLVTSGTTTRRCVQGLIRFHRRLLDHLDKTTSAEAEAEIGLVASQRIGRLQIRYFRPLMRAKSDPSEPVQSHLKLTIIDERIMVLGSGNMDRASWYTSQELGVAFVSSELVQRVTTCWSEAMKDRTSLVYDAAMRIQSAH